MSHSAPRSSWLSEIPFFNAPSEDERTRFVVAITMELESKAFAPQEWIYRVGDVSHEM